MDDKLKNCFDGTQFRLACHWLVTIACFWLDAGKNVGCLQSLGQPPRGCYRFCLGRPALLFAAQSVFSHCPPCYSRCSLHKYWNLSCCWRHSRLKFFGLLFSKKVSFKKAGKVWDFYTQGICFTGFLSDFRYNDELHKQKNSADNGWLNEIIFLRFLKGTQFRVVVPFKKIRIVKSDGNAWFAHKIK